MDHSESVAAEILVREAVPADAGSLVFRRRRRAHVMLGCGSWGTLLVVPMVILFASGEIPARAGSLALVPVVSVGLALWAVVLRELVDGARLSLEARVLRFCCGPVFPWPDRSWPLASIAGARIEIHPDSFAYPATYRGYPMARPYLVHLVHHDGTSSKVPLVLGLSDASEVAVWIERAARS